MFRKEASNVKPTYMCTKKRSHIFAPRKLDICRHLPICSAKTFVYIDGVCVCREHRVCMAACCRDDLSDNSSPHTSTHSSRISHRVQIDFPEEENDTNGSSLDFYEAKVSIELVYCVLLKLRTLC